MGRERQVRRAFTSMLGVLLGCLAGAVPKVANAADATPVVAAVKVVQEALTQEVSFDAELRPYEEIALHAKVSGYLKTMHVDVGDVVKAGQVIATLEVPELESEREHALAAERRAQAEIARGQAEIQRAQAANKEAALARSRLVTANKAQPKLIAQQDLDTAEARAQTAEAMLAAAEASLAAAKQQAEAAQAEVRKVTTLLDYTRVTAPFAGVITRRQFDAGALVQSGTSSSAMPLARLSQNNKLRVAFPVSLSFVSRIKVGNPVEVRVPALGKSFKASVSRFSQRVETATRTMEVEADLLNDDLTLIPGVYATAVVKLETRQAALTVPVEAVARGKDAATVLVVTPGGKTQERSVKLGVETPTRLEIVSGLVEGDLVMIGSRTQIKPGQVVEVKLVASPRTD